MEKIGMKACPKCGQVYLAPPLQAKPNLVSQLRETYPHLTKEECERLFDKFQEMCGVCATEGIEEPTL